MVGFGSGDFSCITSARRACAEANGVLARGGCASAMPTPHRLLSFSGGYKEEEEATHTALVSSLLANVA